MLEYCLIAGVLLVICICVFLFAKKRIKRSQHKRRVKAIRNTSERVGEAERLVNGIDFSTLDHVKFDHLKTVPHSSFDTCEFGFIFQDLIRADRDHFEVYFSNCACYVSECKKLLNDLNRLKDINSRFDVDDDTYDLECKLIDAIKKRIPACPTFNITVKDEDTGATKVRSYTYEEFRTILFRS